MLRIVGVTLIAASIAGLLFFGITKLMSQGNGQYVSCPSGYSVMSQREANGGILFTCSKN